MNIKKSDMSKVLETGIKLSKEKDRNVLFNDILDCCMSITGCDAGTLYLVEDDSLSFKVMKTISLSIDKGRNGEKIDLPNVPLRETNICAYSVIHKLTVNIEDVYKSDLFDFSGPRNYDKMTGYHTQSMLTIPLLNQEEHVVGVLQLINAKDEAGTIIPFDADYEKILLSLASQAAIAVANIKYMQEIEEQMWSFTEAMAVAIDARTPYNATHIRKVAEYAGLVADAINAAHFLGKEDEFFDKNRKNQLVMAALLHDLGKIVTPRDVMNKATKLEKSIELMMARFHSFKDKYKIAYLEGRLDEASYQNKIASVDEVIELSNKINATEFLDDETEARLQSVLDLKYEEPGTEPIPYFTDYEKENLLIKKGTLTKEEREIMENHVTLTAQILSNVHFNEAYAPVAGWASMHHEYLDGSGYPNHIKGDALCTEARILAVCDICDALLASDRPYKKPKSKEVAFKIMDSMVNEGKLDKKYVDYLRTILMEA